MATRVLLRSALKSQDLAPRCLPATAAATLTVTPLVSNRLRSMVARLFSSNVSGLELAKQREALEVTDDIVDSEAKLHALFLKWLSYYEHHHFDVEDEKAFKERFEIFKGKARFVNQDNKSGSSSTCGLNGDADLTTEELGRYLGSWKTNRKFTK